MYMYLLSYCAKLGLEKADNHFQCFSSYTHKSHKPSRSDWQVHSTISSDFILAQCVQSIHTDHNLRPWSAQSNNSTFQTLLSKTYSMQLTKLELHFSYNWTCSFMSQEYWFILSQCSFQNCAPYLPTFSGPCPNFWLYLTLFGEIIFEPRKAWSQYFKLFP